MRRLRLHCGLAIALTLSPAIAQAADQPAVLPGQPGGDPAPDTAEAIDFLQKGRYEDAITASRRALSRNEHHTPALLAMAKSYYYLRKYELATAIVELTQKVDSKNAESYNLLGFIALTRNDNIGATAAFKRATELKDSFGSAWNNLSAQYILAKNYDSALTTAERAVKLLPKFEKAHLNLGSALRGKQQYAEAERSYLKALELNQSYAEAYFNLGVLYLDAPKMHDLELVAKLNTAIGHLAKYKNLAGARLTKDDPSDAYVEEAKKGIDREQKRLLRLEKQKERDQAKPATPATAPVKAADPVPPPKAPEPTKPSVSDAATKTPAATESTPAAKATGSDKTAKPSTATEPAPAKPPILEKAAKPSTATEPAPAKPPTDEGGKK